jgi:cytochrome c553
MKKPRSIGILVALAMTSTMAVAAEVPGVERAAAARLAVGTCATCHGAQGTSQLPKFPNLAGQPAAYIAQQLKAFRSHTRGDPDALAFMWGIAAPLDDALIDALADYYSAQPVRTASGSNSILQARGRSIFEAGVAGAGVPACSACHGPNGEGMNDFPRLAGQHREYFLKQMLSFQHNLRVNDPMRQFASGLAPDELAALAAYVSTL